MRSTLLIISILVGSNTFQFSAGKEERNWYYCSSKPASQVTTGKAYIFYSEVKKLASSDSAVSWKRVKEWSAYIKAHCNNPGGCSGDLNRASSYEDGQQQLARFLKHYSDTSRFVLIKTDF